MTLVSSVTGRQRPPDPRAMYRFRCRTALRRRGSLARHRRGSLARHDAVASAIREELRRADRAVPGTPDPTFLPVGAAISFCACVLLLRLDRLHFLRRVLRQCAILDAAVIVQFGPGHCAVTDPNRKRLVGAMKANQASPLPCVATRADMPMEASFFQKS